MTIWHILKDVPKLLVNTKAVDALAPCITRSAAARFWSSRIISPLPPCVRISNTHIMSYMVMLQIMQLNIGVASTRKSQHQNDKWRLCKSDKTALISLVVYIWSTIPSCCQPGDQKILSGDGELRDDIELDWFGNIIKQHHSGSDGIPAAISPTAKSYSRAAAHRIKIKCHEIREHFKCHRVSSDPLERIQCP